ncbi:hypothetical protein SARC_12491 [Sphaeroforma arctica JP610]|uniref:Uncharacterized protein n=1 Tax=Sphaeroforma arctica JP610 TaxID=667725 RepID=A0A0L0FDZ3_9EUKA|nr:hypothetical protein SARC_12491 [Sphaeroforma arctica JP610]KNC74975.1 hypothetical protein SARC_12491 [Sphaeroforma arctica JP610]|eukprot:XP_014148877.1 hypothetical protein SARC_12491 [Sphaeroforma arctica JP610]
MGSGKPGFINPAYQIVSLHEPKACEGYLDRQRAEVLILCSNVTDDDTCAELLKPSK